jgi:hypothetical protein
MLMLNWVFGKLDGTLIVTPKVGRMGAGIQTLKGFVEAIGLPDLHLLLLDILLLLKKVKKPVVSYRTK